MCKVTAVTYKRATGNSSFQRDRYQHVHLIFDNAWNYCIRLMVRVVLVTVTYIFRSIFQLQKVWVRLYTVAPFAETECVKFCLI